MSNPLPAAAVSIAVIVAIYSTICLISSLLLFYVLIINERRITYVLILSLLVSIATLASIIQQIHYCVAFEQIHQGVFQQRKQEHQDAGAAISNGSFGVDLVLFYIQFYTYNADGLLILFWAAALFKGTWRLQIKKNVIGSSPEHLENAAKVFALLFPAFLLGIAQIPVIREHNVPFAILANACLVSSTSAGSILLILTLYKFIQSRRSLNGSLSGSHNANNYIHNSTNPSSTSAPAVLARRTQRAIDRSIILRFTIAFSLLSAFNIINIIFQINSLNAASAPSTATAPDFSLGSAVGDILTFLPGVTCSLVCWVIWGTTKRHMQTSRELLCCCFAPRGKGASWWRKDGSGDVEAIGGFERLGEGSKLGAGRGMVGMGGMGGRDGKGKSEILVRTVLRRETELRDLSGLAGEPTLGVGERRVVIERG